MYSPLLVAAIAGLLFVMSVAILMSACAIQERGDRRYERLRIEHEALKAERKLHDLTSDAFQRMLDVTRKHRQDGR